MATSNRRVVISGCSGGGKSTLLMALSARGYRTVQEPGRRVISAELSAGRDGVPWGDLERFLRCAIDVALADWREASAHAGTVFFDRGLVDAASALQALTGEPALDLCSSHAYHRQVFMAPPWPEIYVNDSERQHGIHQAITEHERLAAAYPALGYEVVELPKTSPAERADFVIRHAAHQSG